MNLPVVNDRPLKAVLLELLSRQLKEQRYMFLEGDAFRRVLAVTPEEVFDFATHWATLTLDRHMGDGGTYRYRRYGEFDARPNRQRRQLPHGPYEQPLSINCLNGGVPRWFDPLETSFVMDSLTNRLLDWLTQLYDQCEGKPQHWNIRLHPYRIRADTDQPGNPTPEGLHRDGVDYIVSMMVSRENVEGGESLVTDEHGQTLCRQTLTNPLDIMIGQDTTTLHAVTPITRKDSHKPAWRDVLVVAFTKASA